MSGDGLSYVTEALYLLCTFAIVAVRVIKRKCSLRNSSPERQVVKEGVDERVFTELHFISLFTDFNLPY